MIVTGKNVIIYVNGVAIGAAKSCQIRVETDMLEVASPTSAYWKQCVTTRSGWSVHVGCLVTQVDMVLYAGLQVEMSCALASRPNYRWLHGNMICKTAEVVATIGTLAQGAYQFVGNGELYGDNV